MRTNRLDIHGILVKFPQSFLQYLTMVFLVMGLIIMAGCRMQQNNSETNIREISWMVGSWWHENDSLWENIVVQQEYIECVVYHIEDGQAIVSERRRIYEDDGILRMTTTVFYKDENEFSNFKLTSQEANRLVFACSDSDSDELIIYEKISEGRMKMIQGNKGTGRQKEIHLIMDHVP